MKRVPILSFAAAILFTLHVQAALPPLYQGIKEIQAILESAELAQKLPSGDVIEEIKRTDTGFSITTNKRELQVHVTYVKTGKIGPDDFTLRFDESINIRID